MSLSNTILPGQTIGLIGGNLSARLLAIAAKTLGYQVGLLEEASCLASDVVDFQVFANANDFASLTDFASKCDVLVYTDEQLDSTTVQNLSPYMRIPQGFEILSIAQDRVIEKSFLESLNINIAPYSTITSENDLLLALRSIGYPAIFRSIQLPTTESDVLLYEEKDITLVKERLSHGACILESHIAGARELSIVIVRNQLGEVMTYPVSEIVIDSQGRPYVQAPAPLSSETIIEMSFIAEQVAHAVSLVGALTVDFALTDLKAIYVKAVHARPSNTAVYSLDTCNMSQYEAMIRAVCGLPLDNVVMHSSCLTVFIQPQMMEELATQLVLKPDWRFHLFERSSWQLFAKGQRPEGGSYQDLEMLACINIPTKQLDKTILEAQATNLI